MLLKVTYFRSIGLLVYDMYKTIKGHICPNINGLGAEIYFAGIAAVLVDWIALVQRETMGLWLPPIVERAFQRTERTNSCTASVLHMYVNIRLRLDAHVLEPCA